MEIIKYWGFEYNMSEEERERYDKGELKLIQCPEKIQDADCIVIRQIMSYKEAKKKFWYCPIFKKLK